MASPTPPQEGPGLFDAPPVEKAYTVSSLTEAISSRVSELGRVSVEGELSGLKRPRSGHLYFDLKDGKAVLSCAIWRSRLGAALGFDPREGMQLVAHGRLDVYAPRGSYSLIVERLEERGLGQLLARLEALKAELRAAGWFDRARPLPQMPKPIGVVTSRDGAALRDFLRTRSLRWPLYPLRLAHSRVQGPGASADIAAAIARLDASGVGAIALIRGGGSLEDLWAFNERVVAEAIRAASVPVVSGVGHESDLSLADLVADHRAHTPTDAAQSLIPDRSELLRRLERAAGHLSEAGTGALARRVERFQRLAQARPLRDARWILEQRERGLGAARARLAGAGRAGAATHARRLLELGARLERVSPQARVGALGSRLERASRALLSSGAARIDGAARLLALAARGLEASSPLAVLGRGYSLARVSGEHELLRSVSGVQAGDELETQLAEGSLRSRVLEVIPGGVVSRKEDGGCASTPSS